MGPMVGLKPFPMRFFSIPGLKFLAEVLLVEKKTPDNNSRLVRHSA
jgi:hypothetical protein